MIEKAKYVPKGWGFERWIVNNDKYCGKELFVAKDRKFSVHYHEKKDETFYVIEGQAELKWIMLPEETNWDDSQFRKFCDAMNIETLNPGDVFHIPVRMAHQITAIRDFTMMEFSTHHDDEDSYRIVRGD
jgi:mannose-6-phosphate isomerase-like protein (cupin superfamily)